MNQKSVIQNPQPNRNQGLDPITRVVSTPTEGQIQTINNNEELKRKIQTNQRNKKIDPNAKIFNVSSPSPLQPSFPPSSSSNLPPSSNLLDNTKIPSSFLPPPPSPSSSLPPSFPSFHLPSNIHHPSSSILPPESLSSFHPSGFPPPSSFSAIPHPPSTSSIAVPIPSSSSINVPLAKTLLNSNPKPFYPTTDPSHDLNEKNNFKETNKEQKEKKTLKATAAAWKITEDKALGHVLPMMTTVNTIQASNISSNNNLLQNLGIINNRENKAPLGNFPPLNIANGKPLANIEQNKVDIVNFEGASKQENTNVIVDNQIGGGCGIKKKLALNKNAKEFEFTINNGENEIEKQQAQNNKVIQLEKDNSLLEKESQLQMKLKNERLEKQKLEEERLEKERILEQELELERVENELKEKERLEKERVEKERADKEKEEKDKKEKEKELEQEKLKEKQRADEKIEKEKKDKLNNKEKYKKTDEVAKNRYNLNSENSSKYEIIKQVKEGPFTQTSAESPKIVEIVNVIEKEAIKEKKESIQVLNSQEQKEEEIKNEVEKLGKKEEELRKEEEGRKEEERRKKEKKSKEFLKSLIELGKKQKSEENVPDYLQNIFRRHFQILSLKNKKITLVYDSSKEIERSEIVIKPTVVPIWVHPGDQDETKKFQKNVVFNLNLLTPDNFEKIRVILLDLIKNNKPGISFLVEKIIEKAWTEIKYTSTYANLCLWLQKSNDLLEIIEEGKTKKKSIFKNVLFEHIQRAFENPLELSAQPENLDNEKIKDFLSKKKKKMIGNVQFIGELYLTKVLPFKVILICSNTMLKHYINHLKLSITTKRELLSKESEIDIEALLNLLEKVGKMFEKEKSNDDSKSKSDHSSLAEGLKKLQKTGEIDEKMLSFEELSFEGFFEFLEKMKESPILETRIKLIIHNLIERRKENWKERLFANEGPKKIEQLHNEYEREQQEIDKRASEFREKEREYESSYSRRSTTSNISKDPKQSFQVTGDNQKTRKDSQELITAPGGNASKLKLSFSVNRENKPSQPIVQESKFTAQDVNERLKDYFSKINSSSLPSIESLAPLPKTLLLSKFLSSFADGTPEQSEIRLKLPSKLIQEKIITKEEFTKEFNKYINSAAEISCDLPLLPGWMGKMWLGVGARIEDIRGREEEEDDEVAEFMEGMIKKLKEMEKDGLLNEQEIKEIEKLKEKWVERV